DRPSQPAVRWVWHGRSLPPAATPRMRSSSATPAETSAQTRLPFRPSAPRNFLVSTRLAVKARLVWRPALAVRESGAKATARNSSTTPGPTEFTAFLTPTTAPALPVSTTRRSDTEYTVRATTWGYSDLVELEFMAKTSRQIALEFTGSAITPALTLASL